MPQNCTVCILIPQQYLGLVFFLRRECWEENCFGVSQMCMLINYTQEYKYSIPVGKAGKPFYSVKLGDLWP